MGLYTTALIRILKLIKQYGVKGKSLCMVGRQQLLINEDSFCHVMNKVNISYDYGEYESLLKDGMIHYNSYRFFKMTGLEEVHAIDVMASDGADIICDLNEALPESLFEKFDYVIDSGTMEHVFDTANAIRNLSMMLKPGGIIVHILAAAGYIDHGFYSYSPGFFNDFYSANGFDVLDIDLEFMMAEGKWSSGDYEKKVSVYSPDLRMFDSSPENWGRDDLNGLVHRICKLDEVGHVYIWAIARKENETAKILYPMQGMYQCIQKMTVKPTEGVTNEYDFNKIICFFENHQNEKIGIIPAGGDSEIAIGQLYSRDLEDRLYKVFDNSLEKAGNYIRGGFCVYYPTEKKLEDIDVLLICSRNYEEEIFQGLIKRGIAESKLVRWSNL